MFFTREATYTTISYPESTFCTFCPFRTLNRGRDMEGEGGGVTFGQKVLP